jgi:hypothetical protein
MLSVNSITQYSKATIAVVIVLFTSLFTQAQENSPYSRYGMGDLVPSQSISSRSMGGISAGFMDSFLVRSLGTGLNLNNPASLGHIKSTLFDFGIEVDRKTLKSNTSPTKYTANNAIISYFQLGLPISTPKMLKKDMSMGLSFGLRPVTKVNYKIVAGSYLRGIDTVGTLYEGSGGINQVNISTGLRIKKFNVGITGAYNFGNKETSSKREFLVDTTNYSSSNQVVKTNFSGFSISLGAQYGFLLKDSSKLTIGASANLQHRLNGKRDNLDETFIFGTNNEILNIDTIRYLGGVKGKIIMPASYTVGFTYSDKESHWIVGSDINIAQWSNYRNYGQTDAVKNSMKLHVGAQYFPAKLTTPASKYWQFVKYRAGFYYGNDYINLGAKRPDYAFTFGTGMPITSLRNNPNNNRSNDFIMLNTGIEIGQRGNRVNQSLREGVFRVNFGVSISTSSWFQKRKYY